MIYALPIIQGQISQHFGQSTQFAIIKTGENKEIIESKFVDMPECEHSAFAS